MKSDLPPTLSEIIRHKLLPWSQQSATQTFILARGQMSTAQMPPGAQISHHEIRGKRVVVKNRREYGNTRSVAARWPESGLNEVNKLKLACVLNGHIDYQLGDYRLQCGPGHFIFIPPETPHPDSTRSYVDTRKSASCEILFFLLHPNALQCWLSRSQPNQGRKQEGNYLILHERITLLFRALMEEVIGEETRSNVIGQQLLTVFFSVLLREAEAGHCKPVGGGEFNIPSNDSSEILLRTNFSARLEKHIQANLHTTLTIKEVAREMFLSRAQFTRTVRRETGKTFNQLVSEYRLLEAQKLLCDSQWTASAIAAFVGFKSVSYFRTFFHKHTGSTPSAFRADYLKTNL